MNYKKFGELIYVRLDKDDEIISCITNVCKKENILSATYSGIGACDYVEVRTYLPDEDKYRADIEKGVLELISLTGNITADDNDNLFEHSHAIFSYVKNNEVKFIGGHLTKAVISYTGEFVITPVVGAVIRRMKDKITGIDVWKL